MPPSASAMFPDNPGRFQSSHPCNLQRATHTPPRKNKQKQINNIHFQFNGILTVLVRRPCASSKHRLDKGGKPKVDASPRCLFHYASSMFPPHLYDSATGPSEFPIWRWASARFSRLKMMRKIIIKSCQNRCHF